MPLTRSLLLFGVSSLFAQSQNSFVPVGDDAAWVTVGLVLAGTAYGCLKLLDRLYGRAPRNTETTARN